MTPRWELFRHFLVRSTGFPWGALDELHSASLARVIGAQLDAEARLTDLQASFRPQFDRWVDHLQQCQEPRSTFTFWYQAPGWVRKAKPFPAEWVADAESRWPEHPLAGWVADWSSTVGQVAHLQAEVERAYAVELPRMQQRLRDIVADPRFQEALLLSNPHMLEQAVPSYLRHAPGNRNNKVRQLERRFYTYLQRFCAKNETAAFFGPVHYGQLDQAAATALSVTQSAELTACRKAYLAYWAAEALAERIASNPAVRPALTLVLSPEISVAEGTVVKAGKSFPLPDMVARLLSLVDGGRPLAEVATLAGTTCQEAAEVLEPLLKRRIVHLVIPLAGTSFDPLADLVDWVAAASAACPAIQSWAKRLGWLQGELERFPPLPLPEKTAALIALEQAFSEWTGTAARRDHGQVYADRLVVYEEAEGHLQRFTVGGGLAADLQLALQPSLDLAAAFSLRVRRAYRQRARELLLGLTPDGAPVPLASFLEAMSADSWDPYADPDVLDWLALLNLRASEHVGRDNVIRIPVDLVAELSGPSEPPEVLVTSPDLLLAARSREALESGDYVPVLGELHYGTQVTTNFLSLHPNPAGVLQDLRAAVSAPAGSRLSNAVFKRRQGKTFYLELGAHSLELLGRSALRREHVTRLADAVVLADPEGYPKLHDRQRGIDIRLTFADPRSPLGWVLGLPPVIPAPIDLGMQTPRVEVAGVVYQRSTWKLQSALWLDRRPASREQAPIMALLCRVCKENGLPTRFFARIPTERKPVYIDLHNPFAGDLFLHLLGQSPEVTLTELLPDAGDMWLTHGSHRFTCEWRMVAIKAPRQTEGA